MTNKAARIIRLITGITLSLMLAVSGLLLILSCISIYQSGPRPFTSERIGTHFATIQIPIYITLALVALGAFLHVLLPRESEKKRIAHDRRALLARMERRVDTTDSAYAEIAKREKELRTLLRIAAVALPILLTVPFLVHLLTYGFTEDYNASVIAALPTLLLASLASVGAQCLLSFLRDASLKRQTEAAKQLLAGGRLSTNADTETSVQRSNTAVLLAVRAVVAVAALVLLILGILNGGMADVLDKAINICTECIGLG